MGGTATLRLKIIRIQQDDKSPTKDQVINIYRVEIVDLEKKGFLILKSKIGKQLKLLEEQQYVFDRVKISINKKGEVVVHSTSQTNVREEESDTFTVHSLELSQRNEDIDQMI